MCNVCEVVCSRGVTNGIVHNAKCVMYVRSSVVGETQMALSSMPNVQRKTVIKIECIAINSQNQDFLLVESSNSRPLIGREDYQKESKGLTLIQKCTFGIVHNAKCAMSATPSVVGDTHLAFCTMPNVQCLRPQVK